MKEHASNQPVLPVGGSGVRLARGSSKAVRDSKAVREEYRQGSWLDEQSDGASATNAVPAATLKQRQEEHDLSLLQLDGWTLAKGWKNRPRLGKTFDLAVKMEDVNRFKERYDRARLRGDGRRGFKFGYHGDGDEGGAQRGHTIPPLDSFGATLAGRGGGVSLAPSTASSYVRRTTSKATLIHDVSYVSSLAGAEKIDTVGKFFAVDRSALLGEKYAVSDVQAILQSIISLPSVRDSHSGSFMVSPTSGRFGPRGQPLLLPRAGSPLERARTITFGFCRRFPRDPQLQRPPPSSPIKARR